MMFSLKTAKGVSSCGGRAVNRMSGRFCGYATRSRRPFSKGSVTVSSAQVRGSATEAAVSSPAVLRNWRRSRPASREEGWGFTGKKLVCESVSKNKQHRDAERADGGRGGEPDHQRPETQLAEAREIRLQAD